MRGLKISTTMKSGLKLLTAPWCTPEERVVVIDRESNRYVHLHEYIVPIRLHFSISRCNLGCMGIGSLVNSRCRVMVTGLSCRCAGTNSSCHEAHLGVGCVLRHIFPNAHVPSGPVEGCQSDDRGWIDPLRRLNSVFCHCRRDM